MPPPSITTDLPTPAFPGQSPGRGEGGLPGGGGGGSGGGGEPGDADDEPQAASEVLIPIAAIVRSIAELPTAFPIAVRNSRRAIFSFSELTQFPRCGISRNLTSSLITIAYQVHTALLNLAIRPEIEVEIPCVPGRSYGLGRFILVRRS